MPTTTAAASRQHPRVESTTSDLQTLPMHLFPAPNAKPQLPHTILDLTPKLLLCLARDSCIQQSIPCTLLEFLDWRYRYRNLLDSESDRTLSGLWRYDERNNSFIIRCMPSPVHKSISEGLSWNILQAVYCSIKVNPILNGIHVHTNRDITELGPTKNSSRCPDLQIEVQTTQQDIFISGIIVEVGFSQSLASLYEKATGWFQDLPDLHMCILVDITEQAQEYVDSAGQKISKSKAKKVQNEWPDWLMRDASSTLTLKEEIVRRIGGGMIKTKAEGEQVLVGIKEDLRKWLLEKDGQEVLIPALVEPMDATIYVYARAGNDESEQVDSDGQVGDGQVGDGQVGDGQVGEGISPHAAGSDARYPDGDDDNNNYSSFNSSSSITISSDSETDSTGLSLIFSAPFLASSKPIPPSSHVPTYLAFTIAELYGPLPQPTPSRINSNSESPLVSTIPSGLLGVIPPTIRPHAHKMITITFDELAKLVLDSSAQLKKERAKLRAGKMVDREWLKVCKSMREASEAKKREERRSERAERVVQRRKRKAQDDDVEVGPQDTDEERAGTRVRKIRG
ncbi:hypothetical protein L211DRAFT_56203 [Terfezia boudieri ATCC MYA-4762]|uniref:Uncharacterized protein n=1 Tax=Terfezia boudieri ATCC MYA-4762 TaxID=1051890 RepID=A0A3N4LX90_9PEZI|nr:hypothetical protein L211DRAFT_56203 [Terfezia boudieri ATCC MYA-4762]